MGACSVATPPHPPPLSRKRARGAIFGGLLAFLAAIACPTVLLASNDAKPVQLIEELPTLKCLGVRWIIAGDDNRNAEVSVAYREAASPGTDSPWKNGPNLFRVQSEAVREANRPAAGQTMFAGSIFDLDEDTDYEVKLVLHDPDGVEAAGRCHAHRADEDLVRAAASGRREDDRSAARPTPAGAARGQAR